MERQRSRSRDSPNACDMTPTRPLSPTVPFLESSSSTPERLTPAESVLLERQEPEGEPERGLDPNRAWDRDVLCRRVHENREALRPHPLVNLPHQEPRRGAFQSAGLQFGDDNPLIHTPPARPPVRDNIAVAEPLPASSIGFSSAWPESPPPAQPSRID